MATIDPDPPANAAKLAATLPGTLEAVTGWTEGVQAFCARHGVAARAASQAALVFEEILTNLVQHGGGAGLTLEASLEVTTGELRGEVVDDGAAFDPLQVPPPDLEATLEELRSRDVNVIGEPFDVAVIGQRVAFITDNSGNVIEITEPGTWP